MGDNHCMASLRKEKNSPFWFIRYRDLDTGRWRDKSTKLRHDTPNESRKARKMADEFSVRESQVAPTVSGNFNSWVPLFMEQNYKNPNSLIRYQTAWAHIEKFLNFNNLKHPTQIKYIHSEIYMEWRKKSVKHNSARLELKLLSFILNESIRREHIVNNPLLNAKISKEDPDEKPEISYEQFKAIQELMKEKPKWMNIIFHVCAYTGCRYSDGNITLSQIDFPNNMVLLTDGKRKKTSKKKLYFMPMHESLKEFLKKFFEEEPNFSKKLSPSDNTHFNSVLKKATGIENMTSQCNRVSFVTNCHRSGLTIQQSKLLVNHSSSVVHDVYSRLNNHDRQVALNQVNLPV